ncbi:hypothetical protein F5050DRAFT_1087199 [Lentinula boryana]|uniref:Uncharacterized protein n=1 Tax=Lentinula boryana TaxID=40481 RepID=A0ABQ8QKH1_9AGAR|nr:hypothetical protein F5050DRAFT_1087199 [Lentinula boryana]
MPDIQELTSHNADLKPARPTRSLPSVPPSQRLKSQQQMQMDAPEWRPTLAQSLKISRIRVITETLDYETLKRRPRASGLTPEVVFQIITKNQSGEYQLFAAIQKMLDLYESRDILKDVLQEDPHLKLLVNRVFNQLVADIGVAMMDEVPDQHFTFIDPCTALPASDLDSKKEEHLRYYELAISQIVDQAELLHFLIGNAGGDQSRVVIGIPATQIGLLAASLLEMSGIHTNLYLVSGLIHAIACAKMRPYCITIDVASVLSWYEQSGAEKGAIIPGNLEGEALLEHPGVIAIQSIVRYYKLHSIPTKIIGRNFRNVHELSLFGHEFFALFLSQSMMDEAHQVRLPFYIPSITASRQMYSERTRHDRSVPSEAARAAPTFSSAVTSSMQGDLETPEYYKLDSDWLYSSRSMNPPHPAFPSSDILFSSITLASLSATNVQMEKLNQVIQTRARYWVELRVLPLAELYDRRRKSGIWNDVGERYGCTPPAPPLSADVKQRDNVSSSTELKKKNTMKDLGRGLPTPKPSKPTPIASPKPRRPPLRRPSSCRTNKVPASNPTLDHSTTATTTTQTQTISGGYASDEEVEKIIALTFGAHMLRVCGTEEEKAQSEQEATRLLKDAFSGTLPSPMEQNTLVHDGTSSSQIQIQVGQTGLSKGKQQVLALTALLKAREESEHKGDSGTKGTKAVQGNMVEGVDFF